MQTIKDIRRDTRHLIMLGKASAGLGEPLDSLITRLADQKVSLFVRRPDNAHLYCVAPSVLRGYRESISPLSHLVSGNHLDIDYSVVEANHFQYLVLSSTDYVELLYADTDLSVKLFSGAAFQDKDKINFSLTSAVQFFEKHQPNTYYHQLTQAKFALFFSSGKLPIMLEMNSIRIKAEDLLVSRTALIELLGEEGELDETLPPELMNHLQPWKSEFLHAMNIAAYNLYSNYNKEEDINSNIKSSLIQEAIKANIDTDSETKISLSATLLRPEHDEVHIKRFLGNSTIECYPSYFSLKLIYINEKCKELHDNYLANKEVPKQVKEIENNLKIDKIISEEAGRRLAREIEPIYEKIKPYSR